MPAALHAISDRAADVLRGRRHAPPHTRADRERLVLAIWRSCRVRARRADRRRRDAAAPHRLTGRSPGEHAGARSGGRHDQREQRSRSPTLSAIASTRGSASVLARTVTPRLSATRPPGLVVIGVLTDQVDATRGTGGRVVRHIEWVPCAGGTTYLQLRMLAVEAQVQEVNDLLEHRDPRVCADARVGEGRARELDEPCVEVLSLDPDLLERLGLLHGDEQLVDLGEQALAALLVGLAAEPDDPSDLARTSRRRDVRVVARRRHELRRQRGVVAQHVRQEDRVCAPVRDAEDARRPRARARG